MGVKVVVKTRELYPVGEYLARIDGSELVQNGKVKIKMTILDPRLLNKPISRNFPYNVSTSSHLGQFLDAVGLNVASLAAGQEFDLDIINGRTVFVTITPYNGPQGTSNSISGFRSSQGVAVPPAAAPAVAPVAQQPAPAIAPQAPAAQAPAPQAPSAPAAGGPQLKW